MDSVQNTRTVYGILNLAADVGGVSIVLFLIFRYFFNWIASKSLKNFLLNSIFSNEKLEKLNFV